MEALKDMEREQQEIVRKYLQHRKMMRQSENTMARAALDTRMLQDANDRVFEVLPPGLPLIEDTVLETANGDDLSARLKVEWSRGRVDRSRRSTMHPSHRQPSWLQITTTQQSTALCRTWPTMP